MQRKYLKSALQSVAAFCFFAPGVIAQADGLSTYGSPGLLDMPSATTSADGTLNWTTSLMDGHTRNSLHFQITPRLSGVFRYSILRNYFGAGRDLYDRSFDLHYLLSEEQQHIPALAFGLRDFGGTGVFQGEYFVASKHFRENRLSLSLGLGWGRLASFGGFSNPLGAISPKFRTRPGPISNINETGRVALNSFFRGDAAFFGGVEYQANDRTRLVLEYSSDAYPTEARRMGFKHRTPINVGVNYRYNDHLTMNAAVIGGAQAELGFTYMLDPRAPRAPGGTERPAPVLMPQAEIAALGWSLEDLGASNTRLDAALRRQKLDLQSYAQSGSTAQIVMQNPSYRAEAEALGRAAREMANTLPTEIDTFEITLAKGGMPTSRTVIRRADLHELEHAWDGSWQSFVRADISDAPDRLPPAPGVYPRLGWDILPYFRSSLFDPDDPVRMDVGLAASASYKIAPGFSLNAVVRQKVIGTLDQSTRISNSILPHVRSDAPLYDKLQGPEITLLTADYLFRPGNNLYGRVSAGIFEQMYGGVSSEILWYPQGSRLALGAEMNYVAQREPGSRMGFTDYRIATGHASAYYDFGNSYRGQLDVGRYLAGDWGGTLTISREFDNGFRIGAFMTLTDVPFDDFGEGSFDKGISFTIPLDWITGEPTRTGFSQTIRPILRDGGARVGIAHRLYEEVRSSNASDLEHGWGKFWR
ncbi:exopolysaccharide biosynthesis protein YbjH [Rhodobacter aestuarii]|uniref:Exopolysaccharide biosynthesis protein YbjH n=1 Tax=Rhodobacter aestuarii TaxID=453582 RepID=A0A1N7MAM0_9RHOB|nr:YjbH domain-containing protein [Rhodobacter aestuarii]PTV94952.1 exopolysaccharide biosynthesis protein YbjH [Rhodobacter aestuarii]SIS83021.1 Exopolysaccharide biosynthesis protein YbjH [Rhodobacter aestuarii]